ncbi:MAG: agmatine deiminase family protein [Planctomycetota bacterium]|nr:agmatine deiminase family protein [Planctomycetota bacterium]
MFFSHFIATILSATQPQGLPFSELIYPEGSETPRYLTKEEQLHIQRYPIQVPVRGNVEAPTGVVHCTAEYEPTDAILLAWEGFSSIVANMAAKITTIGEAKAIVVVDSTSEQSSALSQISSYGGDTSKVEFVVRTTDTVWIRDYGPRYIYENGCRAIVDHTYNRPRPNDNALNSHLGPLFSHGYYEIPLIHGGGNFHLNAYDYGWATELIVDENPSLSETQIRDYWSEFQNLDVTITGAFPTSIDYTQHIDMWMCWASDTTCVISDWPYNVNSTQDQICDATASTLEFLGYSVVRIPARSESWTHYTYANSVICNGLVLVPSYSNSQISQHNQEAINGWQQACPDKTIVSIPCEDIVGSAGVMHCICMHVPKHSGGEVPAAYVKYPDGGEILIANQSIQIKWLADDDEGIEEVNIEYSSDAGSTWEMIAQQIPHTGSHVWTVPDQNTEFGSLRVTAIDGDSISVTDYSDDFFEIIGGTLVGDVTGDGLINITDILVVMANWGPCFGNCPTDLNGDDQTGVSDLLIIISNW